MRMVWFTAAGALPLAVLLMLVLVFVLMAFIMSLIRAR